VRTRIIAQELRIHAPFTAFGTFTGIVIMAGIIHADLSREVSARLFWTFHPLHVLLSAFVTAAMFRLHGNRGLWRTLWIGYLGSVGIATLSDSIIPYVGELLLNLPHRGIHIGAIERWWLVNPLAIAGIALAFVRPRTRFPHATHVLLSTWASLFHMTMALGGVPDVFTVIVIAAFLFLAVWVPCCTSDIVFPLLFTRAGSAEDRPDA